MVDDFVEKIKAHQGPLFYNSEGSTEAYKLCIRHLSASMSAGLATLSSGYIVPKDILYIVDLEKRDIEVVSEKIKLINLVSLS